MNESKTGTQWFRLSVRHSGLRQDTKMVLSASFDIERSIRFIITATPSEIRVASMIRRSGWEASRS